MPHNKKPSAVQCKACRAQGTRGRVKGKAQGKMLWSLSNYLSKGSVYSCLRGPAPSTCLHKLFPREEDPCPPNRSQRPPPLSTIPPDEMRQEKKKKGSRQEQEGGGRREEAGEREGKRAGSRAEKGGEGMCKGCTHRHTHGSQHALTRGQEEE